MANTLYIDKYRPTSHYNLLFNIEAYKKLLSNTDASNPVIVKGPSGCGKRLLVELFLNEKFTKPSINKNQIIKFKNNSKELKYRYIYNSYYYIIDPSIYGIYDKVILQNFINFITQNVNNVKYHKYVVINNAHKLTTKAQLSIRRTIETKSDRLAFIFIENSYYNMIPAIKSRCITYLLEGPTKEIITQHLKHIIDNETSEIREATELIKSIDIDKIIMKNGLNLKYCINELNVIVEKIKNGYIGDLYNSFTDGYYTNILTYLCQKEKDISVIEDIRKNIYMLLIFDNEPLDIIMEINNRLLLLSPNNNIFISKLLECIIDFGSDIIKCNEHIYHMEKYIWNIWDICDNMI
jgi:DNA polymerase III delta prime subunit